MWKKLILGLLLVTALFAAAVAMQPDDYRVTRTATIKAPASAVFPLLNDFHNFDQWSPWAKLDPNMKTTLEGAPSGKGAVYTWKGNSDAGAGRMTITDSQPGERVAIDLEFEEPFASSSKTVFELAPAPGGVSVTWSMTGKNNFLSKAFCLLMGGMDRMVGPDFEKGLTQLKIAAEASKP
jgi:uncharacterized protein YndB with AHSA1/START domain